MKTYNILNFRRWLNVVMKTKMPLSKNQTRKQRKGLAWWDASPSEHFGDRKKIVEATLKDGSKEKMLLKNALKAGLSWKFQTQ